jgi:DNA repair protein RadB
MEIIKINSGSDVINKLLNGGYENDIMTTVYGPAGSGKTTMCLLCAISMIKSGKKVIYIDTEGGFSIERLKQLKDYNEEIIKNILILKPTDFDDQYKIFKNVNTMVNDKIGLIIVDTISMLYRIENSKNRERKNVNKDMSLQVSMLTEITRKKNIPMLLTNQVYSDFKQKDAVKMVGGDLLRYSSKCLLELIQYKTYRKLKIIKHRSIPEHKEIVFKIVHDGFEEVTE